MIKSREGAHEIMNNGTPRRQAANNLCLDAIKLDDLIG